MSETTDPTQQLAKLRELVERMKVAMLVTVDDEGGLRSRPLHTLQVDEAGRLWFFVASDSAKVEEVDEHGHQLNLSYADPGQQDYVSITGTGRTVRDREKMRAHWSKWVEVWFPKGLDDPNLALLEVTVTRAEYWDAPGNAVTRLWGLAKALATGDKSGLGDHAKIG